MEIKKTFVESAEIGEMKVAVDELAQGISEIATYVQRFAQQAVTYDTLASFIDIIRMEGADLLERHELIRLLECMPRIEADLDKWGKILEGRVSSQASKKEVMNNFKLLPVEILKKIAEMEYPRLIVKVPEPLSQTVMDLDDNRFPGQDPVQNLADDGEGNGGYDDESLWGPVPDALEYEIMDGVPEPQETTDVDGAVISGTIAEKLEKYEKKFNAGNGGAVTILSTCGGVAFWRLCQEDKKDPVTGAGVVLPSVKTCTYFNRDHQNVESNQVPQGDWNYREFKLGDRVSSQRDDVMRCRAAVVVYRHKV